MYIICRWLYMYICMYMYTYTYLFVYIYMYACMYVRTYVRTYVCMYNVWVHIYIYNDTRYHTSSTSPSPTTSSRSPSPPKVSRSTPSVNSLQRSKRCWTSLLSAQACLDFRVVYCVFCIHSVYGYGYINVWWCKCMVMYVSVVICETSIYGCVCMCMQICM